MGDFLPARQHGRRIEGGFRVSTHPSEVALQAARVDAWPTVELHRRTAVRRTAVAMARMAVAAGLLRHTYMITCIACGSARLTEVVPGFEPVDDPLIIRPARHQHVHRAVLDHEHLVSSRSVL